jgi:hypothetical protein
LAHFVALTCPFSITDCKLAKFKVARLNDPFTCGITCVQAMARREFRWGHSSNELCGRASL